MQQPERKTGKPSAQTLMECQWSRQFIVEWDRTAAVVKEKYAALVASRLCAYCELPCAVCPHFNPHSVSAWMSMHGIQGRGAVIGYDILAHEINGTIETRRGGDGELFMGIRRFVVRADKREEFNAKSHVHEWSAFRPSDAAYKHSVGAYAGLGWTARRVVPMDDALVFVYDPAVRKRAITKNPSEKTVAPRELRNAVMDRGLGEEWPLFAARRLAMLAEAAARQ